MRSDVRAGSLELGPNSTQRGSGDVGKHVHVPHRLLRQRLVERRMGEQGEIATSQIVFRFQGLFPALSQRGLVPMRSKRAERAGELLLKVTVESAALAPRDPGEVNELVMDLVVARPGRGAKPQSRRHTTHLVEAEADSKQTAMVDGRKLPELPAAPRGVRLPAPLLFRIAAFSLQESEGRRYGGGRPLAVVPFAPAERVRERFGDVPATRRNDSEGSRIHIESKSKL